jgi:hypothetical protein
MNTQHKCEWCHEPLAWIAETVNGARYLCQVHYSELERARKAQRLANLSTSAVALLKSFGVTA